MTSKFDPRIVANYIIEHARRPIRQIALNKLLYFSHGMFLVRFKEPLVSGYFEAWHYGPVHPAIYQSFKSFGSSAIDEPATAKDVRTGLSKPLPKLDCELAIEVIDLTLLSYRRFTDGQLVDLSHAAGGPWDEIKRKSTNEKMIGLRIPNELILEKFGMHKLSSCKLTDSGDVYGSEDTPIAYNGFG